MGILNLIKKFFNEKRVTETAVTNFSDLVILPSREELKQKCGQIERLNHIKQDYIHQISRKKLLTSIEIEALKLRTESDMYQELIVNCMLKYADEEISNRKNNFSKLQRRQNKLYRMLKLKIYACKIEQLENETILHLIALKEILLEKPFLMPHKKNGIKVTIENLSLLKTLLSSNQIACEQEIERDVIEYGIIETIPSEEEKQVQNQKLEELNQMLNKLSIKEVELQIKNPSEAIEIATKEYALEMYVYHNKPMVLELKKELTGLIEEFKNGEQLETLSKKFQELETKYNVFMQYGYNLIAKEELVNLYTMKFHILTQNIYEQDLTFLKEASRIELECYEQIIFQKISDVLNGNKPWLQNDVYKTSGVASVSKILKNSKGEFNPLGILNNIKLLSFLLAFDKENGLIEFYQKTFEGKHLHHDFVDGYAYGCEWEDNLSLYTIYLVRYLSDTRNKDIISQTCDKDPYYNLFKCALINHKIKGSILNGIIKVQENSLFMQQLTGRVGPWDSYKTPTSLREYNYAMKNKTFHTLRLNEGLKIIGDGAFENCHMNNLFIPSTLEYMGKGAFIGATVEESIYINNYRQFKKNFLDFDKFISIFFQFEDTGKEVVKYYQSSETKWPYSNSSRALNFCDIGTNYHIFRLVPKFRDLSIMENEKVVLTLYKSDFDFVMERSTFEILSSDSIRGSIQENSNKEVKDYVCNLIETRLADRIPSYKQKVKK